MDDVLVVTLTLMALFAILVIVIGYFLPYVKICNGELQEWEAHRMIQIFFFEKSKNLRIYLIGMGVAIIVSHVALVWFGKSADLKASIVMVVASGVGRFFLGKYKNDVFALMQTEYLSVEKSVGVYVQEIAYIVLIISAVIALGIDIYNVFFSKGEKSDIAE